MSPLDLPLPGAYEGTFWLGVLCGCVGGLVLSVGVWWLARFVRIERIWHWSQTQGDE